MRESSMFGGGAAGSVKPSTERQRFDDLSLDVKNGGSEMNLLALLHEKGTDNCSFRMMHVHDMLLLHNGSITAWFFTSKKTNKVLVKNRCNLNVDHIMDSFCSDPVPETETRKTRKVAMLYRGKQQAPTYLTESELRYHLEHKVLNDSVSIIQKLGFPEEEFSILKVNWVAGHCIAEAKRFASEASPFVDVRIEERMRPLDAFLARYSPIPELANRVFPHTTEAWVNTKVLQRVRNICTDMAMHVESVTGRKVKQFESFFKLASFNQLTFMFPVSMELVPITPPKHMVEMAANMIAKAKRVRPFREFHLKKQDSSGEAKVLSDPLPSSAWPPDQNLSGKSTVDVAAGVRKKKPTSQESPSDEEEDRVDELIHEESTKKESSTRLPIPTARHDFKHKTNQREEKVKGKKATSEKKKPRAPITPRVRRENPVRKLLTAYTESDASSKRIEKWWKEKKRLEDLKEKKKLELEEQDHLRIPRMRTSEQHKAFLRELRLKVEQKLRKDNKEIKPKSPTKSRKKEGAEKDSDHSSDSKYIGMEQETALDDHMDPKSNGSNLTTKEGDDGISDSMHMEMDKGTTLYVEPKSNDSSLSKQENVTLRKEGENVLLDSKHMEMDKETTLDDAINLSKEENIERTKTQEPSGLEVFVKEVASFAIRAALQGFEQPRTGMVIDTTHFVEEGVALSILDSKENDFLREALREEYPQNVNSFSHQ